MRGRMPMTKREARVMTVCAAKLLPGLTVWDIGAGTGSLTVEAALLTPGGLVFAVERDTEGAGLTEQNCSRFGVGNVTVVTGEAPDALAQLPDPHRVLIGGSGGKLDRIFAVCAERLLPDGILVVNAISPRNMTKALDFLASPPFGQPEGVYLQASRLEKLGGETIFRAQNGIWILSAIKEAQQ